LTKQTKRTNGQAIIVRTLPDEYARIQRYAQLRGRPVARVTRELALSALEAEARALDANEEENTDRQPT
jgi:hypothetical protein